MKIYYIKGKGGSNTCTPMNHTLTGSIKFECIVKLNGLGFIPWGMSPDSGWGGGSEDADCRFFTTTGPNWYFDYGSYRHGPVRASAFGTALQTHKIKIEGSAFYIKVTDLDEDTVLINQTISSYGVPNGPWMLGTTSNLQFYEGKVWVGDTLTIDCKADATGLKNLLTNSYYTLNDVEYGNYDEIVVPVPSTDPQSNNSISTFLGPLLLRRRFVGSGSTPQYTGGYTFGGTFDKNGNSISIGNPFSGDNVSDGFLDAAILNDTNPSYVLFSTDNPCHPTTLRYWSGWHAEGYANLTLYGDNNGTWVELGSWTNVSCNRFFRSDLAIPTYSGNYTNWKIRMDEEHARVCGNFTFDSSLPPITSQVISSYSQISMNGRNQSGDINSVFDQEWEGIYWQRKSWSSGILSFTCTEPVIGIRVIRKNYPINYSIEAGGVNYGSYSADSGLNLFGATIPASTPVTISFSQAGYTVFSVSDIVPAIRGSLT